MINLEIAEDFRDQVDSDLIEQTALTTLQNRSVPENAELTIVITDDEQIQALNHRFMDINAPTDVLSFPADFLNPENKTRYLGDIVISFPKAMSQAANGEQSIMSEIQLLIVHGVLHLLGHDHTNPSEKATMWDAQKEVLHRLGIENIRIADGT